MGIRPLILLDQMILSSVGWSSLSADASPVSSEFPAKRRVRLEYGLGLLPSRRGRVTSIQDPSIGSSPSPAR